MNIRERLDRIGALLGGKLEKGDLYLVMELIGAKDFPSELIDEIRLYSEYLPKTEELGFSEKQKHLHFLWDCIDRLPIGLIVDFVFIFKRMIAKQLFKQCGERFIAEQNVQFNFGQNLSVGDDVFINRNTFIDTKGGVEIGNSSGLGENVIIFSHSHSEARHSERSYGKVIIGNYVKIYSCAMILPGVKIGDEAIVSAKALVSRNVPPKTVVAGIPAVPVRERKSDGNDGDLLNHIWLNRGAFQE